MSAFACPLLDELAGMVTVPLLEAGFTFESRISSKNETSASGSFLDAIGFGAGASLAVAVLPTAFAVVLGDDDAETAVVEVDFAAVVDDFDEDETDEAAPAMVDWALLIAGLTDDFTPASSF